MIGAEQIRAARAYLGWSQDDLARTTGLSVTTIRNLESGEMSPRSTTMNVIRRALETSGIEFIDGGGVRRRNVDVKVFQGRKSADEFFEHMIQNVREKGGEIVAVFRSYDVMAKSCDVRAGRLGRFEEMSRHAAIKCLLPEALDPSWSTEAIQFRTILRQHIGPASYFVYGDEHAIILADGASLRFLVFSSASIAEDYRTHFFTMWGMAPPVCVELRRPARRAKD